MNIRALVARRRNWAGFLILLVVGVVVIAWATRSPRPAREHSNHEEHEEEAAAKGPHGGRMLADGDFSIEVTVFERGVPPEFRVYTYQGGEPVTPGDVALQIELHRFGGRVDRIGFAPREDYLLGDAEVVEPHSFDVDVSADHKGATHHWTYDSYEGRTSMSPEAVRNAGIVIENVSAANIRTTISASGRVVPDEEHMLQVIPRYPGIVNRITKQLGDPVKAGEVVAIVESNESLQPYEVKSAITGTVIRKRVAQGEFAREGEAIYTVADLGRVWVDLNIHRRDFNRLKTGQDVLIVGGEGLSARGVISYISPFGAEDTQTMLARVVLPNPNRVWRPGLFVTGEIVVEEARVPVAVKASALQTFRDWDVVFMHDGDTFEIAILELGRRDDEWVEVLSGIAAGQEYASENSFVVKADIGKSGASHDH